ncbi:MAG: hypothetical protein KAI66_05065 [Lentisphaeria bacterium]|nr:hypothetical protein [Lentisphaeria bacterium]
MQQHLRTIGSLAWFPLLVGMLIPAQGCATYNAPVKPPRGIFTHIRAPLTTKFGNTPCGKATRKASSAHSHYACPYGRYSVAIGSANIEKAARKAGITEIAYADYEYISILWLYSRFTINVHGN